MSTIDFIERHGQLTRLRPDYQVETVRGHFMLSLNGQTVIMRKTRGRNRFQFCDISDVLSFNEVK